MCGCEREGLSLNIGLGTTRKKQQKSRERERESAPTLFESGEGELPIGNWTGVGGIGTRGPER